jgi:sulfonate transport system permease protein
MTRAHRLALRQGALGLALPLLLVVLWETIGRLGLVRPNLLPPPSAVIATLVDLARNGELAGHIEITLLRVLLGFLIGTAAGTALGALCGCSRLCRALFDPSVQALRSIPSIAWVPLFVLWLGIFETAKIALIAVGVFFPVYLNLMAGIRDVDRKLVEVGQIYRFPPLTLVRRILIPAALPSYVTGLRGGLGLGWMFVVAAEIMGASQGLGYLMIDGEETGRPAAILAAILLFAIFGKLSDFGLVWIGRHALAWQDSIGNAADQRLIEAV